MADMQSPPSMGLKALLSPQRLMPIQEMYKVAVRSNQSWGVDGYEAPRLYHDPKPNKLYEKKTINDDVKKKLKKGDYLEYTLKVAASLPGPNAFQTPKNWVDEKMKSKAKIKYGDRITYVEQIFKDSKHRSVPGPGAYNLRKDPKEEEKNRPKQKKIDKDKIPLRQSFLCEAEYVSNTLPGPGIYYPRLEIRKNKETKPNREDFKKKLKESQKKSEKQADGFHYSPYPVTFDTFGKLSVDIEAKKPGRIKLKRLSNEKRWEDDKKAKEKGALTPGPGHYPLIAHWPGKLEKGKKKDDKQEKDWMKLITKGIEKSIYYE